MTTTEPTQQATPNGTPAAPPAAVSTAIVKAQSPAAEAWALRQREGTALSKSTLLPKEFHENLPNVLIAMDIAERIGASLFMVAQNLDIIHGRPSWRASFLIATVNASKRFTPLRFRFEGTPGKDDWGCRAFAKDISDGEPCIGPLVTIATAKAEGWFSKSGSKWQTLPELMLHYRSAAFWTRVYCPELALGIRTTEENEDSIIDVPVEIEPAPRPSPPEQDGRRIKLGAQQSPVAGGSPPSTEQRSNAPNAGTVRDEGSAQPVRADSGPSVTAGETASTRKPRAPREQAKSDDPPFGSPAQETPPAAKPETKPPIDWDMALTSIWKRIDAAKALEELDPIDEDIKSLESQGAPSKGMALVKNHAADRAAKLAP